MKISTKQEARGAPSLLFLQWNRFLWNTFYIVCNIFWRFLITGKIFPPFGVTVKYKNLPDFFLSTNPQPINHIIFILIVLRGSPRSEDIRHWPSGELHPHEGRERQMGEKRSPDSPGPEDHCRSRRTIISRVGRKLFHRALPFLSSANRFKFLQVAFSPPCLWHAPPSGRGGHIYHSPPAGGA